MEDDTLGSEAVGSEAVGATGAADDQPQRPQRARGGRAAKRTAILDGAVRVFAAEGFSRASIDSIAREAGVSTRTIYNHFLDKDDLFRTVVGDSAEALAGAEVALIDEHLGDGSDPETELTSFARAWLDPDQTQSAHIALVRQLAVEADRIPPEVVAEWRESGPLRVRRALAARFAGWGERGILDFDDVQHATVHFVQLIAAANPGPGSGASHRAETDEWIAAGVRAFLRAYGRG